MNRHEAQCRSTALVSGDLLLLKWILHQFEQDLRCRLEIFALAKNSDKTRALLQNCQLWRTFSVSISTAGSFSLRCGIHNLYQSTLSSIVLRLLGGGWS